MKPFTTNDEWYFHMRFRPNMKGVTPVLSDIPPDTTMKRPDGPHSGNPTVREEVANKKPQHVAWAAERDGGGRGFGFTGGHYHKAGAMTTSASWCSMPFSGAPRSMSPPRA
ncbi:hypothetical protein [Verrucomicrobium spinosum]|uniref:hypothetical protein n=1 Tax=Verrucomicrobium spinosum TaxID=2736 RepID=UPI00094671C9|nr:hypothetical protein [Verrucomicrobium spinosum]